MGWARECPGPRRGWTTSWFAESYQSSITKEISRVTRVYSWHNSSGCHSWWQTWETRKQYGIVARLGNNIAYLGHSETIWHTWDFAQLSVKWRNNYTCTCNLWLCWHWLLPRLPGPRPNPKCVYVSIIRLCGCVRKCVCIYVCMYVYVYLCMCVCMCVCKYVYMYVRVYVCMCVCMYVYMCVCVYVCLFPCMFVYMLVRLPNRLPVATFKLCVSWLSFHMYISMFVCMYVRLYVCICLCKYVLCKWERVAKYVCTYDCVYVCTCVCIYVCMYVSWYVCRREPPDTYVRMFMCIYVRVCVCTCVCMYLCIYVCRREPPQKSHVTQMNEQCHTCGWVMSRI